MKYGPWTFNHDGKAPDCETVQVWCQSQTIGWATLYGEAGSPHNFSWRLDGDDDDIIAYREVIVPETVRFPLWICNIGDRWEVRQAISSRVDAHITFEVEDGKPVNIRVEP